MVERTGVVWVNIFFHIFDFCFGWVLIESSNYSAEFGGVNVSVGVLVEETEDLSDLGDVGIL